MKDIMSVLNNFEYGGLSLVCYVCRSTPGSPVRYGGRAIVHFTTGTAPESVYMEFISSKVALHMEQGSNVLMGIPEKMTEEEVTSLTKPVTNCFRVLSHNARCRRGGSKCSGTRSQCMISPNFWCVGAGEVTPESPKKTHTSYKESRGENISQQASASRAITYLTSTIRLFTTWSK